MFITLTVPLMTSNGISDEKVYLNSFEISEIVPYELTHKRGDSDLWRSLVVMSNGNRYHCLEEPSEIAKLASEE